MNAFGIATISSFPASTEKTKFSTGINIAKERFNFKTDKICYPRQRYILLPEKGDSDEFITVIICIRILNLMLILISFIFH